MKKILQLKMNYSKVTLLLFKNLINEKLKYPHPGGSTFSDIKKL
uniref:Uncharacterized protein n=1 Tax=Anguilla anguilla TaxID=7936 RepID=A0A0E9T8T4_ANGAN